MSHSTSSLGSGSLAQSNPSVFSDFCQAWVSRFPGSELPAAWEEDVRANLKKHKTKVAILREELDKEEMYVEYLDKLLVDIERHRASKANKTEEVKKTSDLTELPRNGEIQSNTNSLTHQEANEVTKQQFLDDHLNSYGTKERNGLHLNLKRNTSRNEEESESTFVTVISVSSPGAGGNKEENKLTTFGKVPSSSGLLNPEIRKKVPPKPPPKGNRRSLGSRDSLNSASSPTTPVSPALSSSTEDQFVARESLGTNSLPRNEALFEGKLSSSSEEALDTVEQPKTRGRPDGIDNDLEDLSSAPTGSIPSKANKIKELMANWEQSNSNQSNKPPIIGAKPSLSKMNSSPGSPRAAKRTDSDSSSRGRMGSPSGKSHDSSDSETSWSRRGSDGSPGAVRRRVSGETRLDRLVRRPSGGDKPQRYTEALPAPALPKPMKKPRAKPRQQLPTPTQENIEEPLYDTVANDDPAEIIEECEYDNHLLYGTNGSASKTDTIGSSGGGSSSADLGFDEPTHHHSQPSHSSSLLKSANSGLSLTGSGTLSSSDTDCLSSPSLRRGISLDEETTNYVNIQYFMQDIGKTASSTGILGQSDDELNRVDEEEEESVSVVTASDSDSSRAPSSSDAERILMYKCILNSIVDSEAIYLEGLSVMLQYMKAMKVTLTTSQPVIPKEEFDVIFYKIPELHELHFTFHESLKKQVDRWNGVDAIGHTFKMLASRTKIYAAFLSNYQKALEALHRCSEAYPQFADLTRSIKLRTVKGQRQGQSLSMEDLLHKPVARVQKHCLCLKDLIKYTPDSHPDYKSLNEALTVVQDFVNEYNTTHAGELFPHQERPQRHLVKNSFIVELHEGQRKLRHLFLFNDVLVCAKYKASNKKTEKFTFQLKWFIPLYSVSPKTQRFRSLETQLPHAL